MNTLSKSRPSDSRLWPLLVLDILAVMTMALAIWAGIIFAGDAVNLAGVEQVAQRIFYFHIGSNIAALLGFLGSVAGSVGYLLTRRLAFDRWAAASVEVGTIFGFFVLLSGSIWAKPAWNTYWTWDPRLTTAAITVLIYVAYMLFRNGFENPATRALFSSIYALFAFLSVPLTFYSARLFRSIHPVIVAGSNQESQGDFALGATMGQALTVSMIGFAILFLALLFHRERQLALQARIEQLQMERDE